MDKGNIQRLLYRCNTSYVHLWFARDDVSDQMGQTNRVFLQEWKSSREIIHAGSQCKHKACSQLFKVSVSLDIV